MHLHEPVNKDSPHFLVNILLPFDEARLSHELPLRVLELIENIKGVLCTILRIPGLFEIDFFNLGIIKKLRELPELLQSILFGFNDLFVETPIWVRGSKGPLLACL